MKKFLIFAVLIGSIFFIAGCSEKTEETEKTEKTKKTEKTEKVEKVEERTSDAFYTFDGGIINLRHVKIISSGWDNKEYKWYIEFDGFKVYYRSSKRERDNDLKIIIDKMKSL